jgi:hypothetical protein
MFLEPEAKNTNEITARSRFRQQARIVLSEKSPSMVTRLKHAVSGCLKHRSQVRWFIAGARNHLQANRSLSFCFEIPV